MKRLLRNLICVVPLFAFVGCGDGEQAPPEKAPEMSPEEEKDMQDEMEMMKKEYKKQ